MRGQIDVPEVSPMLEVAKIERVTYNHAPEDWRHRKSYDGPITICNLYRGEEVVAYGYAYLHPRDQFCRKTGREVSLRDAVKQLDVKNRRNGRRSLNNYAISGRKSG